MAYMDFTIGKQKGVRCVVCIYDGHSQPILLGLVENSFLHLNKFFSEIK